MGHKMQLMKEASLCFNRKFEFRPSAIIFVENTEQVSIIVDFANTQPGVIKLRV